MKRPLAATPLAEVRSRQEALRGRRGPDWGWGLDLGTHSLLEQASAAHPPCGLAWAPSLDGSTLAAQTTPPHCSLLFTFSPCKGESRACRPHLGIPLGTQTPNSPLSPLLLHHSVGEKPQAFLFIHNTDIQNMNPVPQASHTWLPDHGQLPGRGRPDTWEQVSRTRLEPTPHGLSLVNDHLQ